MISRLYINVTNHCNVECPFCCMGSTVSNEEFMSIDTFRNIIRGFQIRNDDEVEIVLEGGEPLTHRYLYLIMQYAKWYVEDECGAVLRIIISTNGVLLRREINKIVDFAESFGVYVLIKPSINYYLTDRDQLIDYRNLLTSIEFVEHVDVRFNARLDLTLQRDRSILDMMDEYKLIECSNVFSFNSYGRYSDTDYPKPIINETVDNWACYSSTGMWFGKDLVGRSKYEMLYSE